MASIEYWHKGTFPRTLLSAKEVLKAERSSVYGKPKKIYKKPKVQMPKGRYDPNFGIFPCHKPKAKSSNAKPRSLSLESFDIEPRRRIARPGLESLDSLIKRDSRIKRPKRSKVKKSEKREL